MTKRLSRLRRRLTGAVALGGFCAAAALLPGVSVNAQTTGAPPGLNLSEPGVGWAGFVPPPQPSREAAWFFNNYGAPATGIGPVTDDPEHPYFNNEMARVLRRQPTYRVADLNNAAGKNLMPWVREALVKQNALVLQGRNGEPREPRCWETGTPAFHLNPGVMNIIQTPKEVALFLVGRVRHIWMDVPHPANPKPSWYGESIGRYDSDTLVVDTIGLNEKTFIDGFLTPHTERLHVTERWHLVDGGRTLEVDIHVDDPGAFTLPWNAIQRYRRAEPQKSENALVAANDATTSAAVAGPMLEASCAENNISYFGGDPLPIPTATAPDF